MSSSHYDNVLRELKEKGQKLAVQYITELYNISRYEEKLPPEDCRARIERDCVDLWSKATIRKYLPPEAMNSKKQLAGKIAAENKKNKKKKEVMLVTATENSQSTELEENCPVGQKEQDSAGLNPAENDFFSQNEKESRSFNNQLNEQLSGRTLSPELLEANKIIADKDKEIEELKKEKEQLRLKEEQYPPKSNNDTLLFLPNKLAMEIFDNITAVISSSGDAAAITGFNLEHDGQQVTSIYAVKIDTLPSSPTNNPSQASHPSQLIEQQTTLKAEESTDHTSTPAAATALEDIVAITNTIHRIHPHSDVFRCDNCKQRGDKWYMQKHLCKGGLS